MTNPASTRASALARIRRILKPRILLGTFVVLAALVASYHAGRASLIATGAVEAVQGRVKLKPGPWGDVEYLPITIAAPRKLLRVQAVENETIHWYFAGMARHDFAATLEAAGVGEELREALLAPANLAIFSEGARLQPSCEMIRALGPGPLGVLYGIMAGTAENNPNRWDFPTRYLGTFSKFGVSRSAASVLESVSIRHGKFTLTYAMPCALAALDDPEEKVGLMKALSQQNSMLVRLRVSPDDDVATLADYWGRGLWTTDVEAILESLKQRPDGGAINILELMPPLPGALLHSYPVPHYYLKGPEVIKNCSWTAFNFFRDTPVDDFSDLSYVMKALADDYHPVLSDPRYGDVAVFLTPERTMRHVAVYLADDLYFTKNGDNPWHPWVYSTLDDLLESFSFGLPEGQRLAVHYFRSKAY